MPRADEGEGLVSPSLYTPTRTQPFPHGLAYTGRWPRWYPSPNSYCWPCTRA